MTNWRKLGPGAWRSDCKRFHIIAIRGLRVVYSTYKRSGERWEKLGMFINDPFGARNAAN